MFAEQLYCDWISARQAMDAEPHETAEIILECMEDDDYGFCCDLGPRLPRVLDRKGLTALVRVVQDRIGRHEAGSYAHRRLAGILRAVYRHRQDVAAYSALCEQEGTVSPEDCESLAEIYLERKRFEEALGWVERGLAPDGGLTRSWNLPKMRRLILQKLGRGEEALAVAWDDYERHPSESRYDELMKYVPKPERAAWRERAIAALDKVELWDRIEVLVKARELDRLADLVEHTPRQALVGLSHYVTEPAAKALSRSHPLEAAKLHAAMGLRIVDAAKSKYYREAVLNFASARNLLLDAGHAADWTALATEVRQRHSRKYGFMSGFERIERGA